MNTIIEAIRLDQRGIAKDKPPEPPKPPRPPDDGEEEEEDDPPYGFAPLRSEQNGHWHVSDGFVTGAQLPGMEAGRLVAVAARHGIVASPLQLKALLRDLTGPDIQQTTFTPEEVRVGFATEVVPSKEEKALRDHIQSTCRRLDRRWDLEPGTMNGRVLTAFGKSRKDMEVPELQEVRAWLARVESDHAA
jgi:hypothetical protein